jgi:uncharacterized protein YggE
MLNKNSRMARNLGLVLIAAVGLLSACAPASSQDAEQGLINTISVTGFGEANGVPDTAMIQLGVSILGDNVTPAIDESNAVMEAITAALSELGIPAENIQTTNFNVWPDERFSPETGLLTGERQVRVESTLQIKVAGTDLVGEVIQAALEAGANNIYGLSFSIDDSSALVSEARSAAIDDAKERAAEIAEAMGVELGDALIINESTSSFPQFSGFAVAETAIGGGAPPLSPGQTTINAQINITFAISR